MAQAKHSIEIGTGLFVLLGLAALAFLTTQLPGSGIQLPSGAPGFSVSAKFDNIGGLKVGAPVSMAGVDIGRVDSIQIDPQDYRAVVTMRIDRQFNQIPDDSDAEIQTSGLLGAQYVSIMPGGSSTYLHAGSQIQFTQSALVLENLINKLFANFASSKGAGGGSGAGGTAGPGGGSGSQAGSTIGHGGGSP